MGWQVLTRPRTPSPRRCRSPKEEPPSISFDGDIAKPDFLSFRESKCKNYRERYKSYHIMTIVLSTLSCILTAAVLITQTECLHWSRGWNPQGKRSAPVVSKNKGVNGEGDGKMTDKITGPKYYQFEASRQ